MSKEDILKKGKEIIGMIPDGPVGGAIITAIVTILIYVITRILEHRSKFKQRIVDAESTLDFFSTKLTVAQFKEKDFVKVFPEGKIYLMNPAGVFKITKKKDESLEGFSIITNSGDKPLKNISIKIGRKNEKGIKNKMEYYGVNFLHPNDHIYLHNAEKRNASFYSVKFKSTADIKYRYIFIFNSLLIIRCSLGYPKISIQRRIKEKNMKFKVYN